MQLDNLFEYVRTLVRELNDDDILIFEKLFSEDQKIVVNKQLHQMFDDLDKNKRRYIGLLYKEAFELKISSAGIISLILIARTQYIEFKQKSANIEFSMTQDKVIAKNQMQSTSTMKSLLRVIEKAEKQLIIFGYDISFPDNPSFLLLKKKVAEGSLKLILIAHDKFLPRFKYHWGLSSFANIDAYVVQFPHENHNMHAKLAIADGKYALITSANLTYQGMKKNIEIGITVEGEKVNALYDDVNAMIDSHKTTIVDWDEIVASLRRR